ncbi:hypothetical protein PF002_g24175 [Phytophthora fragariae]|uniref:FAR1 domain-containing protein n=1 Tax=Phytophthora fragariae TaxID=53985 RepID=A0A6A3U252_9STRA|nr:hypothetical protein PF003_g3534 [Phytophthora fragariae]KAE9143707.1 hypothetical protein PF006_g11288 [Phytophthora fragariae]KAE9192538.1 hypothetical protein PF002_g24175 [Phytophthora fragariae]
MTSPKKKYIIEPPPTLTYPSEAEAEDALHEWTKQHSFNVSRKLVVKDAEGRVVERGFACDRAGRPKNTRSLSDADRTRKMRGSKAIGCPMRIKIVALSSCDPVGPWKIAYTRDGSREHNHPPSFDVRVHVAHRQRDAQRLAQVHLTQSNLMSVQADAGVSTSRIHATMLATDKNTVVIPKDISNAKGKPALNFLLRVQVLRRSSSFFNLKAFITLLKLMNRLGVCAI